MTSRLNDIITMILIVLWTIVIVVSYWAFHPYYSDVFGGLPNVSILLSLLFINGGALMLCSRRKVTVNGLFVYIYLLFQSLLVFGVYSYNHQVFSKLGGHIPYFMGYSLFLHLSVLVVFLIPFTLGSVLLKSLQDRIGQSTFSVVSLAFGLSIIAFLLFLLASIGMLKGWIVMIIYALVGIWRYKDILDKLRFLFLTKIPIFSQKRSTQLPLFAMLIPLPIIMVGMIKTFPTGYDGALLYMNLTHLLVDSGYLIPFGQSYNWELILSLGELLFNHIPVSILIAHCSIILCLWVIYRISRMFMGKAASLLAIGLVLINPAFSFHSFLDEKVDLGFLFVVLSVVLLFIDYFQKQPRPDGDLRLLSFLNNLKVRESYFIFGLAGWLSGFAFGIKYTGVMAIAGIIALIVYRKAGWLSALGTTFLILGLLFLSGINHFAIIDMDGSTDLQIFLICMFVGIASLVYGLRRNYGTFKWLLIHTTIFGICLALNFLPWAVKHISEHDSFSIGHLVQGKPRVPVLDVKGHIEKTFQQSRIPLTVLVREFNDKGVVLDNNQKSIIEQYLKEYALEQSKEPGSKIAIMNTIRDRIANEILRPDQKAAYLSSELKVTTDSNDPNFESIKHSKSAIVQLLDRRGVTLDSSQNIQLEKLLSEYHADGRIVGNQKSSLVEYKDEIIEQITTSEQKDRLNLMEKGDLRRAVDGEVSKSSIFGSAKREEIKRYIGYLKGFPLFFTLPYNMTMNMLVPFSRYLDISFVILLLLPVFFAGTFLWSRILTSIGVVVFLLLAVYSLYSPDGLILTSSELESMIRQQMISDGGWVFSVLESIFLPIQKVLYYAGAKFVFIYQFLEKVTFAVSFILLSLLFYWLAIVSRRTLVSFPEELRMLLVFGGTFGFLWVILGNGILWYGFPVWTCFFILVGYMVSEDFTSDHFVNRIFQRKWLNAVILFYFIFSISLFFISGTQSDRKYASYLYNAPFLNYASSPQSMSQTFRQFIPYMDDAITLLNKDKSSKVYRIGTFFNYHIAKNDRRVLEDNQLEIYERSMLQLRDKEAFFTMLKDQGFRYILFDLNAAMIDKTPDKSLTRRVNHFMYAIAESSQVRPLFTDNFIADPAVPYTLVGDLKIPGKPGYGGQNTRIGSFVLFEVF